MTEPFDRLLKRLRLRAALTQAELADRSGLSVEAISALERGFRRHPRRATLALLADALDLAAAERVAFLETGPLPARGPRRAPADARQVDGLPWSPTQLIGRESELTSARALLGGPGGRVLTISGPPGVGKSRLALELARELAAGRLHEVVHVSLAALSSPDLAAAAVARALALPGGGEPLVERLASHIGSRRVLLVLDDFERLVTAAPLLTELEARCPHLLLLVTSRISLRIRGEQELSLQPLRVPDLGETAPGVLGAVPAVALFLERARAVCPELELTRRSGPIVADICRALDGLPLALELAAPWVRVFTLEALLTQLRERCLSVLVGGARDLPDRQRTMRNALRWSYELLADGERALFRRLSVFAGSPTLHAVEEVCQAAGCLDGEVLQLAAGLVDKNIVRRDARTPGARFGLLEAIRAFGREMLEAEAGGEADVTARAHATYYLALVRATGRECEDTEQAGGLALLDREAAELRAALAWLVERDAEEGLDMAVGLRQYWETRGPWREGLEWLDRFLAAAGEVAPARRARALHAAGVLAHRLGDHAGAIRRLAAGLRLSRVSGDRRGVANALNSLGLVAHSQGHARRAEVLFERGLALYRELGDQRRAGVAVNNLAVTVMHAGDADRAATLLIEIVDIERRLGSTRTAAAALVNLGNASRIAGRHEAAAAYLDESMACFRDLGDDYGTAVVFDSRGDLARSAGDPEGALVAYRESLAIRMRLPDPVGAAACLEGLGAVAWMRRQPERATQLYGAAATLRARLGAPAAAAYRSEHERIVCELQRAMPGRTFARAWSAGGALALSEAASELAGMP